jgi:putative heme-binding domain-containing protein
VAKEKLVFTQRCAICHKAGSEGNLVGPELTTISRKFDRAALLDAVINPDAAIVFGYEPWLINKKERRIFLWVPGRRNEG